MTVSEQPTFGASTPTNLEDFRGILPYASQMFGVYQPLVGYRSRLTHERVVRVSAAAMKQMIDFAAGAVLGIDAEASSPLVGEHRADAGNQAAWAHDSAAASPHQAKKAPAGSASKGTPGGAGSAGGAARTSGGAFGTGGTAHTPGGAFGAGGGAHSEATQRASGGAGGAAHSEGLAKQSNYKASNADTMLVKDQFRRASLPRAAVLAPYTDPLAHFDPATQAAFLSPIGLIQLYRQYFFELDSFLGPPVGHVWVSPGGQLELYEVHTRKLTESRETQQSTDSSSKTETASQSQDDLSTALAHDSNRTMNVAVSAQAGVNFGVFHAGASTSLSMGNTQHASEQTAHKQTRQQSEKVANEIRRSYKTTFKTTLEQTDTQSRRYVLANSGDKLANFEMRRKMRKVGVQVQHVGTQMCWQVFLDNPGDALGIADLIHLAQPADLSGLQPPEAPPVLEPKEETIQVTFPYKWKAGAYDREDGYLKGMGAAGEIVATTVFKVTPPASNYRLADVRMESVTPSDPSATDAFAVPSFAVEPQTITMTVDQVCFDGSPSLIFTLNLLWEPPERTAEEEAAYKKAMAEFAWKEQQLVHAAYVTAVRDRVKAVGLVAKRSSDDMRDEERSVVYQNLLSTLMRVVPDAETNVEVAHVTSELIRSIFDIDSMLYFVAPDWWRPRTRGRSGPPATKQGGAPQGGSKSAPTIPEEMEQHLGADDIVGWNGSRGHRGNNYKVTEESAPAPFGASLGWVLQIDGDDRRNAFLNAPWAKAVIPIRPGKEEAALNWLAKAHVEGTEGLDATYQPEAGAAPVEDEHELKGKTIGEVVRILARKLAKQGTDPEAQRQTETVYENGFDPLAKGFKATGVPFERFDQWVEVLPTDQVVAVEYEPQVT